LECATLARKLFGLKFLVDNAIASRHPLNVTRSDLSTAATGVAMFDFSFKGDSHRLETFVWMCFHTTPSIGWRELKRCDVIEL
jgi:hypothetical protein